MRPEKARLNDVRDFGPSRGGVPPTRKQANKETKEGDWKFLQLAWLYLPVSSDVLRIVADDRNQNWRRPGLDDPLLAPGRHGQRESERV